MRYLLFTVIVAVSLVTLFEGKAFPAEGYVRIGIDNEWNQPRPEKPDLSVIYIKRLPRYPGLKAEYKSVDRGPDGLKGDILPPAIANSATPPSSFPIEDS